MTKITKASSTNKPTAQSKVAEGLRPTDGNDLLRCGLGNDLINGGLGNDTIYASHGNDSVYGGMGADKIWGGHGNDFMVGGDYMRLFDNVSDTFYFEKSDALQSDTIAGFESGGDKINIKLDRNDICIVSDDYYYGNTVISYSNSLSNKVNSILWDEALDNRGEHIKLSTITVNGINSIKKSDIITDAKVIFINADDNSITGTLGNDKFDGSVGNDSLYGSHGDDTLIGSYGSDELWGGHGSDVLFGGRYSRDSYSHSYKDGAPDTFCFMKLDGKGSDYIVGFEAGLDKLKFLGGIKRADIVCMEDVGGSAPHNTSIMYKIAANQTAEIILYDVAPSELSVERDFIFL